MLLVLYAVIVFIFLVIGISISWTTLKGAPWAPTKKKTMEEMLALADLQPDELVCELGCGDGRLVITAARDYGARAVGIEIDLLRYIWCQIRITAGGLRGRVRIVLGDFFKKDISDADVLVCYLLQETMEKLEAKVKKEMKPGSRIVSNYFDFTDIRLKAQTGDAKLFVL